MINLQTKLKEKTVNLSLSPPTNLGGMMIMNFNPVLLLSSPVIHTDPQNLMLSNSHIFNKMDSIVHYPIKIRKIQREI